MKTVFVMAAVAAAALSAGVANAGNFDGSTIQYQFRFPDLGSVGQTQSAVVGPGVEFVDSSDYYIVDLGGSDFTVTDTYGGYNTGSSFNGIVLSDVTDNLSAITGVTFTGGGFAGEQPTLSFDGNNIYLNFAAITQGTAPGTSYSYHVTFGDVPEPASWALMLGGFGMVGGALRSSRKVAVRFA